MSVSSSAALFGHRRDSAYRRRRSLLNALSGAVRAGRRQLRAQFRTRRRKDAEAFLALSPNPSDAHEIDASTARPTLKPCTENSALLQVITLTVLTTRGQLLVRSRGSGQATPYDANHGQKCDFLAIFQCFTRHHLCPFMYNCVPQRGQTLSIVAWSNIPESVQCVECLPNFRGSTHKKTPENITVFKGLFWLRG